MASPVTAPKREATISRSLSHRPFVFQLLDLSHQFVGSIDLFQHPCRRLKASHGRSHLDPDFGQLFRVRAAGSEFFNFELILRRFDFCLGEFHRILATVHFLLRFRASLEETLVLGVFRLDEFEFLERRLQFDQTLIDVQFLNLRCRRFLRSFLQIFPRSIQGRHFQLGIDDGFLQLSDQARACARVE